MRLYHFVTTFGAATQPLTTDRKIVGSQIYVQADEGNSNEFFIGGVNSAGTQAVSSTDYGTRIPAPDADGNPAAPYPIDPWNTKGLMLALNDVWVKGTNGEKVAVSYWK